MKYRLYSRYQYRNATPEIVWTKWFPMINSRMTDTPDELKEDLKMYKEDAKDSVKQTKLKIEFEIREFDDSIIKHYPLIPVPLKEWFNVSGATLKTYKRKKK